MRRSGKGRPSTARSQRSPHRPDAQRPARVAPKDLGIAIWIGAVAVTAWSVIAALQGPAVLALTPLVAHVSGMLAGYGVLVLLGLMSRAPALERGVGADLLARWHARGARVVMTLILLHAWAAVASWAQARDESAPLALWQVLGLPGLMAATAGTAVLVAVAAASVRAARRRLSYERWHLLHLLSYLGIALSFVHQLAGPDIAGHRLLQIAWALLYVHPPAMAGAVRVALRDAGLPPEQLHEERFAW